MMAQRKQKQRIPSNPRGLKNENVLDNDIGMKLLAKMGWKQGDSIGLSNAKITIPLLSNTKANNYGIGHVEGPESLGYIDAYDDLLKKLHVASEPRPEKSEKRKRKKDIEIDKKTNRKIARK